MREKIVIIRIFSKENPKFFNPPTWDTISKKSVEVTRNQSRPRMVSSRHVVYNVYSAAIRSQSLITYPPIISWAFPRRLLDPFNRGPRAYEYIDIKSNSTRAIGDPLTDRARRKRQYIRQGIRSAGPTRRAIRGTVFIRLTGYVDGWPVLSPV